LIYIEQGEQRNHHTPTLSELNVNEKFLSSLLHSRDPAI